MKMSCGSVLALVVSLLVFALSSQAGVAIAAGDESQDKAAPTGEAPPPPAANAASPITSAGAPNAMPIGVGAAPTNNPAPSPGWGAVTAPTLQDQARLDEINRQAQIDEEWRKYRHRRPARWAFISLGGGMFGQTYHGSVNADTLHQVHVGGGYSPASVYQLVPETGYQFTDKFALSQQIRFQHSKGFDDTTTDALAFFVRAQYALLTAGDFQFFGSGVAGFGLAGGGRIFMGYVPKTCDMTASNTQCKPGTGHSDTVSSGPGAVGVGLGITYHVARFFSLWTEVRVLSSFGPTMLLGEFNTGVAFAFPVAPAAPR